MSYTLATAAAACAVNKSTVLRAIKAGKISASKDEHGEWQIEPVELHRVYPPVAPASERTDAPQRYAVAADAMVAAMREQTLDVMVASLRDQLADMRGQRDDMRQERDAWRDQAQRLALPKPESSPEPKPETWWRWLRSTG